jgi:hypothetical protein
MQEAIMVFKPNYNHQRAERDRAKQAKKEAKVREREVAAASRRKSEEDDTPPAAPASDETHGS